MALEVVFDGVGEHLGLPVLALLSILLRCQHHSLGSVFFRVVANYFCHSKKIVVFLHLQTGKNPLAEKSAFFRYSADGETSTTSQKTSRNNGDCSLVLYSYYTTYDKWSVPKILICLFNKGSRSPTVRDRDKWMAPLFSHKLIFVKPPASLKHRSCARHVSG